MAHDHDHSNARIPSATRFSFARAAGPRPPASALPPGGTSVRRGSRVILGILAALALALPVADAFANSNNPAGLVNRTNRNGGVGCAGGGCHVSLSGTDVTSMTTTITGLSSLAAGNSSTYTVSVATTGTGINTLRLGMAIAATGAGTPITKISTPLTPQGAAGSAELIHGSGTGALATLSGGAASYQFTYTVPSTGTGGTTQTLYAVARVGIGSSNGGWAHAPNKSVTVPAVAPTIVSGFGAGTIPLNGSTSLAITITNPAANGVALSNVGFTDFLPAGLVVATPNGLNNTCGGTATATAGASSFSLSAGTVPINSSCTITVNVRGTTAGSKSNNVQVASTQGISNLSSTFITVVSPPTISKAFGAASIPLGSPTSLTYTIQNTNTSNSLSGVGFTDTLPFGLVVDTPNGLTGSCGGGTITAGSGVVSLSNATLAQNSSCNFSVNVFATTAGLKNSTTGNITSTQGGAGGTASANLTVVAPPSIAKAFAPTTIAVNGTSVLTLTITNPTGDNVANIVALTGVTVTDTLPSGLVVATPLVNTCGGTATAGSGSVSLTGGSIAVSASCTLTVSVTSASAGTYNNTTGVVSSANGANGNTASATLTVAGVPGAPTGVTAVAGPAQAIVSFTPPASNGGSAITGYTATCTPVAAGTSGSANGPASPSPITVSGLTNGAAYTCTARAINAVGPGAISTPSNSVTPTKLGQTIAFSSTPPASPVVSGPNYLATATATSGLVVSFTIDATSTPGVCSVAGASVSLLAVGTCVVAADQAGDATYNAAPTVQQSFAIIAGQFALTVTKSGGGTGLVTSTPSGIDCGATCSANFNSGLSVALGAAPSAGSFFKGWSGSGCTGTGACNVTMDAAKSVGAEFKLNTSIPRLANISTRMQVLTGNDVMIGGFIIGGSVPKTVVVRARGPSLIPFGIPNALANPRMDLFSGQDIIATNDNWQTQTIPADVAAITASGFAPTNNLESAIRTTLSPGAYTAVVSGVGNGTGVGIVEVFEVDLPEIPLINISTRGQVLLVNDVMIGGFIIQGDSPQTVVIRARGPSLIPFGIPNALLDPVLQIFDGQTPIATNDDWQVQAIPADVAAIQGSGFAPTDGREAVIRITLQPGAYTAIVTGKNGTTGVGIVEVFAQ